MWPAVGLRLKLGLYIILFVSAVLALVGYLRVSAEREIYVEEMKRRGVTLLRSFAIPCTVAMANNDTPTLDNYVVQFADGRVPILAGVGGNDTRNVIWLSGRAAGAGVDGLLVVAPYYNKPTQAGMLAHFRAVADAAAKPVGAATVSHASAAPTSSCWARVSVP